MSKKLDFSFRVEYFCKAKVTESNKTSAPARGSGWAQCGFVRLQAPVRIAEGFSDLVDKLDCHEKGYIVVERRRLLQPDERCRYAGERNSSTVAGIGEPCVAGTRHEHLRLRKHA